MTARKTPRSREGVTFKGYTQDGRERWLARPVVAGKRTGRVFPSFAEALAWKHDAEQGKAILTGGETVGEWAGRWLTVCPFCKHGPRRGQRRSEGTLEGYGEGIRHVTKHLGNVRLVDVDRPMAAEYVAQAPGYAASTARVMFGDALDLGLVGHNPFDRLNIATKPGRKHDSPLTRKEVHALADMATDEIVKAHILFTAYVGQRAIEGCALRWEDIGDGQVYLRPNKSSPARTVLMLPQAWEAIKDLPRHGHGLVFTNRRGQPLRYGSLNGHFRDVRLAWWPTVDPQRQREIAGGRNYTWHALRHACGHYFYVELGYSDEETAFQLRNSPEMVRSLYGHAKDGALERMRARAGMPRLRAVGEA